MQKTQEGKITERKKEKIDLVNIKAEQKKMNNTNNIFITLSLLTSFNKML